MSVQEMLCHAQSLGEVEGRGHGRGAVTEPLTGDVVNLDIIRPHLLQFLAGFRAASCVDYHDVWPFRLNAPKLNRDLKGLDGVEMGDGESYFVSRLFSLVEISIWVDESLTGIWLIH